jgi:hypothetical protein
MSATASTPDPLGVHAGQSIRRLANRSVRDSARELRVPDDEYVDFMCECGDLRCTEVVTLKLGDFHQFTEPGSISGHRQRDAVK